MRPSPSARSVGSARSRPAGRVREALLGAHQSDDVTHGRKEPSRGLEPSRFPLKRACEVEEIAQDDVHALGLFSYTQEEVRFLGGIDATLEKQVLEPGASRRSGCRSREHPAASRTHRGRRPTNQAGLGLA